MTILEAPSFLAANVDSCYSYRVQLENTDADSVMVDVYGPANTLHSTFALYDDGGSFSVMPPDYACANSGDIVPNNNQFTRRINARLLADSTTGAYSFRFHAPQVGEQRLTVHVQNVSACLMTQWPQVQTFDACFDTMTLEVHVSASSEDIVDSVRVLLCDSTLSCQELAAFHPVAADSIWRLTVTPNLFRCGQHADSGYYMLVYEAATRFGQSCQQSLDVLRLGNELPVLSDVAMPDTIIRPTQPGNFDTTYVTVRLSDCELAGDTSFVGLRFDVSRDDTLHWGPGADFFLRDNGRAGDAVARDQIYTVGLKSDTNYVHPNSVYYFRFYAVEGMILSPNNPAWACDAFHDTSAYVYDNVRLIQPPGLIARNRSGQPAPGPEFQVVR